MTAMAAGKASCIYPMVTKEYSEAPCQTATSRLMNMQTDN